MGDTHEGFDITNLLRLKQNSLPYKDLVQQRKVDMIMIAHVFNRKLDEKYSVSISPITIQGLLRNDSGYKRAAVTDDLSLGAIVNNYSLIDAMIKVIEAGSD